MLRLAGHPEDDPGRYGRAQPVAVRTAVNKRTVPAKAESLRGRTKPTWIELTKNELREV